MRKPRILIVEDDALVRESLASQLAEQYEIVMASWCAARISCCAWRMAVWRSAGRRWDDERGAVDSQMLS